MRARDDAAAQVGLLPVQSRFDERLFDGLDEGVGNVREDQVLPDG